MSRRRPALARLAFAALVAAVLVFAPALAWTAATPASAHDYPVSWSPAPGSTVTEGMPAVSITFDDIVLDLSGDSHTTLLQVTGPGARPRHFETGCATTRGRVITAPVALGGPGTYTVSYQIVSADGHPVSGSASFHYRPASSADRAAGSATSVCRTADAGEQAPAATATPPGASSSAAPAGIVIAIVSVIIGLAVLAVIIVLVASGRRRTPSA